MASDSEIPATDKLYDAFLTHNSADKELVKKFAELLQKKDLSVFLDTDSLVPGEDWQEGLEQGLRQSRTCVVCIGPAGFGPWMRREVGVALNLEVPGSSFRVIPVLLPEAKALAEYDPPAFLTLRHCADFRSGFADVSLLRLVRAIQSTESRAGTDAILARQPEHHVSPIRRPTAQDALVERASNQEASGELARLRKKATLSLAEAQEESRILAERVQSGDLQSASPSVKTEVLQLAAQRHAAAETLDLARSLRDALCQVNPAADTTIIDALILEAEGDADGALRLLRDRKDPDAHNTVFLILSRVKENKVALEWYESQEDRDDPDFFTARGWCNLAIVLTEVDRWEDAASRLASAGKHRSEYADFPYIEGIVNAAFLLPAEFRRLALVTNLFPPRPQEGPEADLRRDHAIVCFREAEAAHMAAQPERAFYAREWSLWLRLTHSDPEEKERARAEIGKELQDVRQGLRLIPLAHLFQISFDVEKYWTHLDLRERTGGLDSKEFHARYVVARERLRPGDFFLFLESEDVRLDQLFPRDMIVIDKLDALVRDGQLVKARTLLEQSRDDLEEIEYRRVTVTLDALEGKDMRADREKLYETTNSLIDLQGLVDHLWSIKDWEALRPLLYELFRREQSLDRLRRLVMCLDHCSGELDREILALLESNEDLAGRDPDLIAARARALFNLGRLGEARTLNDKLLSERSHPNDLDLDINLALQFGDWERFPGVVERERARSEMHKPAELIRLASLAAEDKATASRAFELLNLAAEKGSEDPHVLTQAAGLAYRLGRDDEKPAEWLGKAFALAPEGGPVQKFELRELVEEWMPKHQESRRTAEELWSKGEAPLHLIADHLNIPLSILLVDLPRRNALTQDGRRRTIIPIISGARQPIAVKPEWVVGFDISSLLVLASLGLLKEALESFRGAIVAPDTMVLLLNERREVRFHQPSLVERAKEVRRLIDRGRLRIAETLPEASPDLADEVGIDLAQLLEEARRTQGRVVRPRPIHKLRTFQGEEADLGDYDGLILSAVDLEQLLYETGRVDAATHEKAHQYLRSHDRGSGSHVGAAALQGPIFVDDLALTYLQGAGLLPVLESSRLDFRIHPSVKEEQLALIESEHERKGLEDLLERLRITLRDALQNGKAEFLQRRSSAEDEESATGRVATVVEFLQDVGRCDAVVIDDRYLQKFGKMTDRKGEERPVIGVLDILGHLETQGAITREQRYSVLHKLRQGGFAFVRVELEEVLSYLRAVSWKENEPVVESAELRVIRQTLARIRSLEMLSATELLFLVHLEHTGILAIRQIWADETISESRAFWMASWVWSHVTPSIWGWVKREQVQAERVAEALGPHISALLRPSPVGGERLEAFLHWAQEEVIDPLLPANAVIFDRDLLPRPFEDFERFYGPDPGDSKPEEYLGSVLPDFRRSLLEQDPRKGLKICLVGALREDLCPAPWLEGVDNDSLWEHLIASRPELDPFSLLAALDLAIYRQEDERFHAFSERAVGLLVEDVFLGPNGADCYQLIPALASVVLNRIQLMENGSLRQPLWKRMCAWMQAIFLMRGMYDSGVDLAGSYEMSGQPLLHAGAHANSVDLRREPLVEAGTISPFGLRRQILGRLVTLHNRHRAADRSMPGSEGIRQALERIRPRAAVRLPGPLEGHLLPRTQGRELSDESKEQLLSLDEDLWFENLVLLSQRFALPENLKSTLREVISREIPKNEEQGVEEALTKLWKAGMIAAAERDADVAATVAATVLRIAPDLRRTLIWTTVETLLRAAAAFEEESTWAEWLETQLFGLANRLPEGEMSMLLWQHMQELKKVTRLELGIFRRAEAVASAAASGQW